MIKSSFAEFHIATSALFTAQSSLQINAHNVSNASTTGYSRQYGNISTYTPMSGYGTGMYGMGSYVGSINQHRNVFLDNKYWNAQSLLGESSVKATKNETLQTIMNELSDGGINTDINELFDALQELSVNTGDLTSRNNMLSSAESLTSYIQSLGNKLQQEQKDINTEVSAMVDTINSLGNQIVTLNRQIRNYELNGDNANDLRDKRALLVDELSQYVDVEVKETQRNEDYNEYDPSTGASDLTYSIQINGVDFVKGTDLNELRVQERHVKVVDRINSIAAAIAKGADYSDYEAELKTYGNFSFDGTNLVFEGNPDSADDDQVINGTTEKLASTPVPYLNKESYQKNPNDVEGLYDIYFTQPNVEMNIYSDNLEGQLKGLIDMRDGNNSRGTSLSYGGVTGQNMFGEQYAETTSYKGIPHYMEKLNNFVRTLAMSFNEGVDYSGRELTDVTGHIEGYDLNGDTGAFLFTYVDPDTGLTVNNVSDAGTGNSLANGNSTVLDYSKLNFSNFAVNSDLLEDPHKLALGSTSTYDESDNTVVLSMINIKSDNTLFAEGNMTDYIVTMTTELAVDGKQAIKFETNYTDTTSMISNQRLSVSGVDLNEEMAEMIKNQQMYQAASKLINVIDGIYDTCINRLGNF
ncbi:MAG: flagellar hook-associated protein FlgK [Lachnospirales bacterium]